MGFKKAKRHLEAAACFCVALAHNAALSEANNAAAFLGRYHCLASGPFDRDRRVRSAEEFTERCAREALAWLRLIWAEILFQQHDAAVWEQRELHQLQSSLKGRLKELPCGAA